jgi:hypothetical protein
LAYLKNLRSGLELELRTPTVWPLGSAFVVAAPPSPFILKCGILLSDPEARDALSGILFY